MKIGRATIVGCVVALLASCGVAWAGTQTYYGVSAVSLDGTSLVQLTVPSGSPPPTHADTRTTFVSSLTSFLHEGFEGTTGKDPIPTTLMSPLPTAMGGLQRVASGGGTSTPVDFLFMPAGVTPEIGSRGVVLRDATMLLTLAEPANAFAVDFLRVASVWYGHPDAPAPPLPVITIELLLGEDVVDTMTQPGSYSSRLDNPLTLGFFGISLVDGRTFDRVRFTASGGIYGAFEFDNLLTGTVTVIPLPTGAGLAFAGLGVLAIRRRTRG